MTDVPRRDRPTRDGSAGDELPQEHASRAEGRGGAAPGTITLPDAGTGERRARRTGRSVAGRRRRSLRPVALGVLLLALVGLGVWAVAGAARRLFAGA